MHTVLDLHVHVVLHVDLVLDLHVVLHVDLATAVATRRSTFTVLK